MFTCIFFDEEKHHKSHIHAKYSGHEVVIEIPNGKVLAGDIPNKKLKLLKAWVEIHREELMVNWNLASKGQEIHKIEPLK